MNERWAAATGRPAACGGAWVARGEVGGGWQGVGVGRGVAREALIASEAPDATRGTDGCGAVRPWLVRVQHQRRRLGAPGGMPRRANTTNRPFPFNSALLISIHIHPSDDEFVH